MPERVQFLQMKRNSHQQGFTLLEVLIALSILAVAGAAVLALVQQYVDYSQRMHTHFTDVSMLLNRAATVSVMDKRALRVERRGDHLEVFLPNETDVAATVRNVAIDGTLVPVSLGHSPFQLFAFTGEYDRSVFVISDGLPPPR